MPSLLLTVLWPPLPALAAAPVSPAPTGRIHHDLAAIDGFRAGERTGSGRRFQWDF